MTWHLFTSHYIHACDLWLFMLEQRGFRREKEKEEKKRRREGEGRGEILYFNNDLSRKREYNFRAFACSVGYGFDTTQTQTKNVTFAWKKERERERERRLYWEIAGPEFKKVDFYLTRVYIGQLLVNRSLYIIHVMRNHSSLNFNQKEEGENDYSIGDVLNLFILEKLIDYKNCNLKKIGIAIVINEIIKNSSHF